MDRRTQNADQRIVWPPGQSPESSRVFAQNTIDIQAAPETVWSLLIDCVAWPTWYKHCSDVSVLGGGSVLTDRARFRFKTLRFYFEPVVTVFEPARMLVWSAQGPAGTSGAHAWLIAPIAGGCRVVTEEAQAGLLLAVIGSYTRGVLLKSHNEWLRALKEQAEAKLSR